MRVSVADLSSQRNTGWSVCESQRRIRLGQCWLLEGGGEYPLEIVLDMVLVLVRIVHVLVQVLALILVEGLALQNICRRRLGSLQPWKQILVLAREGNS